MENKVKCGIVGLGMVGGSLLKYFEKKDNYEIKVYDKGKNLGSMEEVEKQDFIYICVPTNFVEGRCDTSIVEDVIYHLGGKGKTIIIKSTVIPGTTQKLQDMFPEHRVLFNPEFLTAETKDQDMAFPDRQIIGYTKQSFVVAKEVMQQLPLAPFERIIPVLEAEVIKYFGNCWFAVKVAFCNQMYDLIEKIGGDYDIVMDGVAADKRIGRTHLKIHHKGFRGFGGYCLKATEKVYQRIGAKVKPVYIKDFVDNYKKGDKVLSYNIQNEAIVEDEVTGVSKRKADNLIKIYYKDKRTITVTDNHPMLVMKDGKLEQVLAKDVKEGDEFLVSGMELKVRVICDECKREYVGSFCKLESIREKTGGHYCDKCYGRHKPEEEKIRSAKLARQAIKNRSPERKLEFILETKKVSRIEKVNGIHDVYSIETKDTHIFMTSFHLIIHNCLPKDSKALLSFADSLQIGLPTLQATNDYNDQLLISQGLDPLNTDKTLNARDCTTPKEEIEYSSSLEIKIKE